MFTTLALTSALLAFLAVSAYTLVCGAIAHRFTVARRQRPAPPAAGALSVCFAARDRRAQIEAWYFKPLSCRAAVVFVHGKDACRGDELKVDSAALAARLHRAGVAVLMIDLRGHGTSSASRLTYGERERHDVLGAVDWLVAQGHGCIGVLGASMGAASALLAAAEEEKVMALVADSPFADFGGMIEHQYQKQCRLPRFFLPGALFLARLLTGVNLRRVSPLRGAAALLGRPVLVIHSEGDRFVPVGHGRDIAAACGARLWTTPTPGHIGSYRGQPAQYTALVLDFFERHLCPCTTLAGARR